MRSQLAGVHQLNADWDIAYQEKSAELTAQMEVLRAREKAKIATIREASAKQEQLIAAKDAELTKCKHENAELAKQVTEAKASLSQS